MQVCPINLDIEMETGTGKTYCYIKTMFELNKRYGWSKFIVVVPSIAIREGVHKSFQMTADHFLEEFGNRVRVFIYNSKQLRVPLGVSRWEEDQWSGESEAGGRLRELSCPFQGSCPVGSVF